jgi:23S rRNA (uridine2552-2'-O)-methyltransferase
VGSAGLVFGVDKQPIAALRYGNVLTLVSDITQDEVAEEIKKRAAGGFDVVLSDLSPNVTGVWDIDQARQIELARCALRVGRRLLRPSGSMLVKVFQGSELREFQTEMRSSFREFRIVKPAASRPESAELYFLGLGFIGDRSE